MTDNRCFPTGEWGRVHPVAENLSIPSQTHTHKHTHTHTPEKIHPHHTHTHQKKKFHPHHKLQFSSNQNTFLAVVIASASFFIFSQLHARCTHMPCKFWFKSMFNIYGVLLLALKKVQIVKNYPSSDLHP